MATVPVNPQQPKEKSSKLAMALDALNSGLKTVDTTFKIKDLMGEKPKKEKSETKEPKQMTNPLVSNR